MSISYEVDFTEDILACRGVKLPRNLMKLKDCHIFTMVNDHVHSAKLNLLPGHLVKKDWLFGPACEMDRKVIYPCSRYRCSVPCPCSSCLKLPTLPCKTIASCCSCGICNKKFEEHTQFHGTFHFDCKFCYNLVHCLPVFNFWFLTNPRLRELFDIVNILVESILMSRILLKTFTQKLGSKIQMVIQFIEITRATMPEWNKFLANGLDVT